MLGFEIKEVHKDLIVAGSTILHNGVVRTVCARDIKRGGFCGTTIFGDSYVLGRQLVKELVYIKPPKIEPV